VVHLKDRACAATSLHGLDGLNKLKVVKIELDYHYDGKLRSLEGLNPEVIELSMDYALHVRSLAGIEGCASMEKLSLHDCQVSSLQPLGGLSSMRELHIHECPVSSLEGLSSTSLQSLDLWQCSDLKHLHGVEHLSTLKSLKVYYCGVTSLRPLAHLGEGLQKLDVCYCKEVQEEILELPNVQSTADVVVRRSNVREVVLAGGLRRAVGPPHP
jgi:Leucine-rich repeat (LRR) protein